MIKFQKGFTLIELLVVIAIIGILAGILFVAIDPAAQTNKAEDAKAKSQLSQARTQSAISFSDTSNSYDDVCTDIVTLVDDCFDSPSA
jgi:prepilin-type N-terminal cleavage/methylation domain-containing protein